MPAMKYHPHNAVLFVTLSLEEGLLLLSNPLIEQLLKSCLARAQFLYPVVVNHFLFESTHLHMLLTVDNPDHVSSFIRHFKTDSAHMLNSILGRDKRTVWCDGYDSPVVLTFARAIMVIAYIYSNPAKDNLVDSIDEYPGVSSWKMWQRGEVAKKWPYLRRPQFRALPHQSHSYSGYSREAERILSETKAVHQFSINPNAWLSAFKITDPVEQAKVNELIVKRVRHLEERAKEARLKEHKRVIGPERLKSQVLDTHYRPKRFGRRMWCLAERRSIRQPFINFLKRLFARAREIRQRWFVGDFSLPYPMGLYPPSMVKLAEPVSIGC